MRKIILICLIVFSYSSVTQAYKQTDWGVKAEIDSTHIEIRFYSSTIVRIIKSPAGTPFQKESFSVIKQPEKTPVKLIKENNILQLKSQSLCVNLNLLTGQVSFEGLDRRPLLVEKDYFIQAPDSKANRPTVRWILDKNEPVYGLGQQQEGKMNLRKESVHLQQENTKIAIPFFQSVKGYGVFWDNYSITHFTDDHNGTTFSSETGDEIDYYFLYGKTMEYKRVAHIC
jgi:alpha-D-xyloside xylohydrolase